MSPVNFKTKCRLAGCSNRSQRTSVPVPKQLRRPNRRPLAAFRGNLRNGRLSLTAKPNTASRLFVSGDGRAHRLSYDLLLIGLTCRIIRSFLSPGSDYLHSLSVVVYHDIRFLRGCDAGAMSRRDPYDAERAVFQHPGEMAGALPDQESVRSFIP